MQIDDIKLGDKVIDSDPHIKREGVVAEKVGVYVAIEWDTGKTTKVNIGRFHQDAGRRTGIYLLKTTP